MARPETHRPPRRQAVIALAAALVAAQAPAAAPALAAAVREPVLKQIALPHNYYYREMYLPQVLSGPSSADWSPDGRDLVLAMQGSLWIHRLGSGETRILTDGPGYDSQPSWSPAGRFVAYASYRDDQVELRLLDLENGVTTSLVRDGAVNLEPRFSPDGKRIAWVSTAFNGRFHVFVADFADGRLSGPVRVSEDRDSGLPRYYYSKFDHALSPVWSPDGSELLYVSNRGHIWGTGGFWRAGARPGAVAREIRYEETTWRARPDWARGGRRIAYASYLGGQWHQIWLMTDEGGDPFPLTYGDFDATNPRFAPDGRRLVYVSNERGNTDLHVLEIPGGRDQRIELGRRIRPEGWGTITVTLADAATGRPIPARVSVMGPDGRFFAPDDAWRYADEMFVRGESAFEYGYFHARGTAVVPVPQGRFRVEVSRGPEYAVDRAVVDVAPGGSATHRAALRQIADLPAKGWRGADLHVHMNYCGAYRNTPANLVSQGEAEGLHLIENLVVNKEQRIPDIRYFSTKPDPASKPDMLLFHGQEYHTSLWGHTGLLGLGEHFLMPAYASYVNTPAASAFPTNTFIFGKAHEQGALTGYVHPFDTRPDPDDEKSPLTYALPVDAALGTLDYLEVMGFSDHLITSEIWYRLLNCGFRIPAGAGTDAMANYASLRGPVGLVRVYAQVGNRFDHPTFLGALKAGKTFVTNAPIVELTLAGTGPGGTVKRGNGPQTLEARLTLRSPVPVDHLEIVQDGKVVATPPLKADRMSAATTVPVTFEKSGWIVLRTWADAPAWPVLDLYPFASTSPVYVEIGGTAASPVPEEGAYFVRWVDRLINATTARTDWNDAAERDETLATLRKARAVYAGIAALPTGATP
ncbi:MAG TPA: CehA/McbA family metallohydrolase [Candidatus Polarisedimenticolia bacterium]|nr:CehA/McbA family metallohydrolase [Candidatus Polarisedimenticolia bacterium]